MVHWLQTPRARHCLALSLLAGQWPLLARAGDLPGTAPAPQQAAALEFNSIFLIGGSGRTVDLRRFSRGNSLPPGVYRADVILNEVRLGSFDVHLGSEDGNGSNVVCLDDALVRRMGLDPSKAPEAIRPLLAGANTDSNAPLSPSACRVIDDVAAGGAARFDSTEQRLELSIPQIYLLRSARGYVSPDRWDSGINAGLLSYQFSDFHVSGASGGTSQRFLGLRAGGNLGDYRFRHDGSFSSDASGRHYQAIATNVQRDIPAWLSTLTLGDGNTDGQLFDSIGFRGVQVASDDRMLPDSLRGYAPVIRGDARTNARVSIRQNGVVLYETVVPPGPFAISDLYPMGSGSNLEVTITEADGTQRVMSVPFSPLPQLLREGALRYGVTIGNVRDVSDAPAAHLIQGTLQRGLSNSVTTELGVQVTPRYAALLVGGAFNTPVGAFALDGTMTRFDAPQLGLRRGASVRASYSKFLPTTLTNFTFAAYRNSTANYFSLRDAMQVERLTGNPPAFATTGRSRERAVLSVNQGLGGSTSLALTYNAQRYWDRVGHDRSFQLSLGWRIGIASVAFTLERNLPSPGTITSTRASVSLNVPLGRASTWSANSQVTHDERTGTSLQAGLSGAAGEDNQYNFNFSEARNRDGNTVSVGGSYRGNAVLLGGSASQAPGFTQRSITAQGGVIVHSGGVAFSNSLGDAIGLVYAPSAPGASVVGVPSSQVNSAGYAVIPFLVPYNLNNIELDMKDAPVDTQLDSTVEQTVPRAGAIVLIGFKGRRGRNVLIQARAEDGSPLPFSATVTDESGQAVGLVGQGSRIEANVASDSGQLAVRWGDGPTDQCTLAYRLPPAAIEKAATFTRAEGVCRRQQRETYSENLRSHDAR